MINIQSTRGVARLQGVKGVIYGRSGIGKTRLAVTAPHVLVISAEAGLLSLRNEDVACVQISTLADLQEIFNWVHNSHEAKNYWTLYLDSVSEIAEIVLAAELANVKDPRQAYGQLLSITTTILKSFRDIPQKHVFVVAKEEVSQDALTKVNLYGPSMPGAKLGQGLPYIFDEILRLDMAQTKEGTKYRYIAAHPGLQFHAKDRSGALDAIEEPNLTKIIDKIIS